MRLSLISSAAIGDPSGFSAASSMSSRSHAPLAPGCAALHQSIDKLVDLRRAPLMKAATLPAIPGRVVALAL